MALASATGECHFFEAPREIRDKIYELIELIYTDRFWGNTIGGSKRWKVVTVMLSGKAVTMPKGIHDTLAISIRYLEEALPILIRLNIIYCGSVSCFEKPVKESNAIKENITSIVSTEEEYKASIAEVVSLCPRLVSVEASICAKPLLDMARAMVMSNWNCESNFYEAVRQLKQMRGLKRFKLRAVQTSQRHTAACDALFKPIEADIQACVTQDRVQGDVG
ncbi:hypothetical protein LTR37_015019 [Vermiconidia calcicola]|uniref:Uncharacterized protein n=1 Tax=Vermiconidia calcicola TaxID=1690605 RepID=A0ACC3MRW7_9PEZI|nr:hypothetical protein LTR37_015019 [Vermiconidia calcicola]